MTIRQLVARAMARLRGSVQVEGTMAAPMAQHYERTEEQKFKDAKGYSMATAPDEWSADIAKHNADVEKEYRDEIAARYAAYLEGAYLPRFASWGLLSADRIEAINNGALLLMDEIAWDLEMSALPGRRTNVTKDSGRPRLEPMTDADLRQVHEVNMLRNAVHQAEVLHNTPRAIIGSRASILAAVGGNEEAADQVEASARRHFNVEDLDAPLPYSHDFSKR